jgi:hypothetical protein
MLDYTAEDLTGRSMYSLCHASDVDKIRQTHTDRKSIFISDSQRTKADLQYFRILDRERVKDTH